MTIATWNINSVRLRLDSVLQFLKEYAPDILCLQEIKCEEVVFPYQAFFDVGYPYIAVHGQKAYNGVAIISRVAFDPAHIYRDVFCDIDERRHEARHIAVDLPLSLPFGLATEPSFTLHNFYVPAGGDIADAVLNPRFGYKLRFLDDMRSYLLEREFAARPTILVGDFNIAPFEHDVWNHKALLSVVSHTPIEIEKLSALQRAGDWVDVARHFVALDQKLYSWWSYRSPNWSQADKGRRLDHIWVSPPLRPHLLEVIHVKQTRFWPKPSDHVPVILRFRS